MRERASARRRTPGDRSRSGATAVATAHVVSVNVGTPRRHPSPRGLVTNALALMRYGLVDRHGTGLHDIWGMSNTTAMAALSLGVVAAFALVMLVVSVRVFTRSAIH